MSQDEDAKELQELVRKEEALRSKLMGKKNVPVFETTDVKEFQGKLDRMVYADLVEISQKLGLDPRVGGPRLKNAIMVKFKEYIASLGFADAEKKAVEQKALSPEQTSKLGSMVRKAMRPNRPV